MQFRNQRINQRVQCSLVELFAGGPAPFPDKTPIVVSTLVATNQFAPKDEPLPDRTPPVVKELIAGCSAFEPTDRPSFQEIVSALSV